MHVRNDHRVFIGLLCLLVWAPLPLGSGRIWAIGLLLMSSLALVAGLLWSQRHALAQLAARLRSFAWPLAALGGMVVLTWFQTLPLPASWVAALSPVAAEVQQPAKWMTLSLDVYQTRMMGLLALSYCLVFAVVLVTVDTEDRLHRVAKVLVWSGVLQAVIGTVLFSMRAEYRIFYTSLVHDRTLGTFDYHNSLAGYLCMCLAIGIGLMLALLGTDKTSLPNWRARIVAATRFLLSSKMHLRLMLVVIVIALVLTRSRMGNTAFFSAMLIVGCLAMVLARKTAPRTVLVLIASLVIVDVLIIGTWVGLEKVVERIQNTEIRVEDGGKAESLEARAEAARMSLPMVKDFPVFGTGGGSFYNLFLSYRTPKYGNAYLGHTHNDFVEIATDYGLLGLGLLGALVASTLWVSLRVMAKRRSSTPWGMAFGVSMAIVGLLIHSTVDFNLQIPSNALTIVVILALGWVTNALPSRRGRASSSKT